MSAPPLSARSNRSTFSGSSPAVRTPRDQIASVSNSNQAALAAPLSTTGQTKYYRTNADGSLSREGSVASNSQPRKQLNGGSRAATPNNNTSTHSANARMTGNKSPAVTAEDIEPLSRELQRLTEQAKLHAEYQQQQPYEEKELINPTDTLSARGTSTEGRAPPQGEEQAEMVEVDDQQEVQGVAGKARSPSEGSTSTTSEMREERRRKLYTRTLMMAGVTCVTPFAIQAIFASAANGRLVIPLLGVGSDDNSSSSSYDPSGNSSSSASATYWRWVQVNVFGHPPSDDMLRNDLRLISSDYIGYPPVPRWMLNKFEWIPRTWSSVWDSLKTIFGIRTVEAILQDWMNGASLLEGGVGSGGLTFPVFLPLFSIGFLFVGQWARELRLVSQVNEEEDSGEGAVEEEILGEEAGEDQPLPEEQASEDDANEEEEAALAVTEEQEQEGTTHHDVSDRVLVEGGADEIIDENGDVVDDDERGHEGHQQVVPPAENTTYSSNSRHNTYLNSSSNTNTPVKYYPEHAQWTAQEMMTYYRQNSSGRQNNSTTAAGVATYTNHGDGVDISAATTTTPGKQLNSSGSYAIRTGTATTTMTTTSSTLQSNSGGELNGSSYSNSGGGIGTSSSVDFSSSVGGAHGSVTLALISPCTTFDLNSLTNAAMKYPVKEVIVQAPRSGSLNASSEGMGGLSPGGDLGAYPDDYSSVGSFSSPGSPRNGGEREQQIIVKNVKGVRVIQVPDIERTILSMKDQYRAENKGKDLPTVAVHKAATSVGQELHSFTHPGDSIYIFTKTLPPAEPASPRSELAAVYAQEETDLSWCDRHVYLSADQSYNSLAALVNISLYDRQTKIRKSQRLQQMGVGKK